MNPNTVFSASLVTSLLLWFPSMQACLRGDLDLAPAGLRYLAALAVSPGERLQAAAAAHVAIPNSTAACRIGTESCMTSPPRYVSLIEWSA